MKKVLGFILLFFVFSCNFNKDIYSGADTKYKKISNENLKKLGDDLEKSFELKYGKIDVLKLKEYEDKKEAYRKHLLRENEKLEYDNILIEGLNRIYEKSIEKLGKSNKSKKELQRNLLEIKKEIKRLNTREDYELYFYTNSNLDKLTY
ncbi:hypothetical protein [Oceanivirga miroungae]|uniref:Lipoprotein n=1 Tax=Oceanivirga miroungae TaxID=1130046 RepID=A0A6I8M7D7_9FUSO|nr:hypothetical protein [Oceanivirga miroungae]VWL85806.1 hypothetical protein OMES3154_01093 [Oceanivirga miroungae]